MGQGHSFLVQFKEEDNNNIMPISIMHHGIRKQKSCFKLHFMRL